MVKRLTLIVGVGAAAAGLMALAGVVYLNQPVVSTGRPQVMSAESDQPTTQLQTLRTSYFVTQVDDMSPRNLTENKAPTLARLLAGGIRPVDGDQLAITVNKLPASGLNDVSDVNLRRLASETYQPASVAGLPEGAVAYRSANGYELSVFWPRQDIYVAIVLTGRPDRAAQLDRHMEVLLEHWQWL